MADSARGQRDTAKTSTKWKLVANALIESRISFTWAILGLNAAGRGGNPESILEAETIGENR